MDKKDDVFYVPTLSGTHRVTHEQLKRSKPIALLSMMAKEDLFLFEAAAKVHISPSASEKHMRKLKTILQARTQHGVILKAKALDLI